MKLLFLDFDGVLNSQNYMSWFVKKYPDKGGGIFDQLDPKKVVFLNEIVEKTDTDIVISSTWRIGKTIEQLRDILVSFGFKYPDKVISKTPNSMSGYRGHEIDIWFKVSDLCGLLEVFVIVDDGSDMEPYMSNLIQTGWRDGMTRRHATKIIGRLNGTT